MFNSFFRIIFLLLPAGLMIAAAGSEYIVYIENAGEQVYLDQNKKSVTVTSTELTDLCTEAGVAALRPWLPNADERDCSGEIDLRDLYIVTVEADADLCRSMETFRKSGMIRYAEELRKHRPLYIPNDPGISQGYQWYLPQIKVYDAWDRWNIAGGDLPGGKNVIIGIVDSGVDYTHPDLQANIAVNQEEISSAVRLKADADKDGFVTSMELLQEYYFDYNGDGVRNLRDLLHSSSPLRDGVDGDGNGYTDDIFGYDLAGNTGLTGDIDAFPTEDEDVDFANRTHGTHVAGIASATTDNWTGIAGVAWDALLLPVKTAADNDKDGYITKGFQGMLYAVKAGARVVNASWGAPEDSRYEQDFVDIIYNNYNAVIVAAAGNGDEDGEVYGRFYPASYANVISVTALGKKDAWNHWANYHETVDISAPGEEITSTVIFDDAGGYGTGTGTSMAAPVVSGAVALIMSAWPTAENAKVEDLLLQNTDNIYTVNSDPEYAGRLGTGRLNVERSLSAITSVEEPPYPAVIPEAFRLSLYPNPFNAVLNISFDQEMDGRAKLDFYDINGRKVLEIENSGHAGVNLIRADLSGLAGGLYFVRVTVNGRVSNAEKAVYLK